MHQGFGDLWHFMFKMTALSQVASLCVLHSNGRTVLKYVLGRSPIRILT